MAPRAKQAENPNGWWEGAYKNHPFISASFEYQFGNDTLVPGTKIKIKNKRGEFKFRCMATNDVTGVSWIDCIEIGSAYRSFYPNQIRNVIKPRRAVRKRTKKV